MTRVLFGSSPPSSYCSGKGLPRQPVEANPQTLADAGAEAVSDARQLLSMSLQQTRQHQRDLWHRTQSAERPEPARRHTGHHHHLKQSPRTPPMIAMAKRTSRRLMPPRSMVSPAKMKNGNASRMKLPVPSAPAARPQEAPYPLGPGNSAPRPFHTCFEPRTAVSCCFNWVRAAVGTDVFALRGGEVDVATPGPTISKRPLGRCNRWLNAPRHLLNRRNMF